MSTQSNNTMTQLSLSRPQMSLKSSLHKMHKVMPSSDLLPCAPPKDDTPEERSAFVIGILDEVLDILNDDLFDDDDDDDDDLDFNTNSDRWL
ncbi:unnamed protein product [Cylindrotheca closterium]|uniref:Uncharacterized protein n=1 Tax=Cylindrotheca closterium TaxID=2856 RepID=A0AAD2G607_9STRA|nr:unnamed protein product [Cylindrotheca closterium]CAJ1960774.1 unnamed protein product [Cylindrotheca closterium]